MVRKMAYFGNQMLKLRVNRNLRQKDIAKILDVKENTYAKWERNTNDLSLEKLNEIANYYQVNLDYLVGLSQKIHTSSYQSIDYNKLKQRLKLLRKKKRLSQEKLSKKIGFAQTTYSSFETGTRIPTAFKLFHIAQFYHVSYDYLVGRKEDPEIEEEKSPSYSLL